MDEVRSQEQRGAIECGLAAVLFGVTVPLAARVADDVNAPTLAGLLYVGAALAVLSFAFRRERASGVGRRGGRPLVVAVTAGGFLGPLLLAAGLSRTPGATASLLLNMRLVATIVLAAMFFGEYTGRQDRDRICVGGRTVRHYRTPPLLAATLVTLIYATVNIAAPLALSTRTLRAGWNHKPSLRNLLGIPILAAGVGTIVWSAASHAIEWRKRDWRVLKLDADHPLTPEYLVTDGPYRRSRNPLYLGDILMWAGWAIFLGSPAVALGLAVLTLGLQVGVRLEERGLARQFGKDWEEYASTVPRFIGRRRDGEAHIAAGGCRVGDRAAPRVETDT